MTTTDDLRHDLTDGMQRLTAQSRVRLAAVQTLREEQRRITDHCRRRLDDSRLLLERSRRTAPGPAERDRLRTAAQQG